jgi:hypothetical protein
MNVVQSRREGFALAGAVLAMVLVGAIVTGGFYAAHQESRVTRSTELSDLAQYIAETGLDATVGSLTATALDGFVTNANNTVANGVNVQYGGRTVGNYTVIVTRITAQLFVVRSTGTVTIGQAGSGSNATRTVSNVVRMRTVNFDNQTAMQVFGDLTVQGTSDIAGTDTNLDNWSGCSTTAGSAAVTAQPTATVEEQGSGNIDGDIRRQAMSGANFTVFGGITWAELVTMATNVYAANSALSQIAPTTTGSPALCNTSDVNNWGMPTDSSHVCAGHFPIIYSAGNMHITSNSTGQGILLVAGDLSIQSQFQFFGPIVVMGTVDFQGGAEIMGSVIAYGGGTIGAESLTAGNMVVQYSSCSIKRATQGATGLVRAIAIRNRSWMDLTTVQNSF